jgi:hypothetical protein
VPRLVELVEKGVDGRIQRLDTNRSRRHIAAERLAAFAQILQFRAVIGWPIKRCVRDLVIRNRDAESRAEDPQIRFVHLLLLMGDVLALTGLAETVALDGAGENDRRLAGGFERGLIGVVHLDGIVAAEAQSFQLLV